MTFAIEYVTPAKRLARQLRASFTGAHTLAKQLRSKGCRSISVNDPSGNEVYYI